jgi:hypothetical protein
MTWRRRATAAMQRRLGVGQVVDEAAGRGDENVGQAVAHAAHVAAKVGAADNRLRGELRRERENGLALLLDLRGELARRRNDDHRHGAAARGGVAGGEQRLDDGQEEGDRLARAGARLGENVDALA